MSGFASGIAGGGGYSASASATSTSGPATGGPLGLNIQGIAGHWRHRDHPAGRALRRARAPGGDRFEAGAEMNWHKTIKAALVVCTVILFLLEEGLE
jgi:hypothetical protein